MRRPVVSSIKGYRVVFHRETAEGLAMVADPEGFLGQARVQGMDRDPVNAAAQRRLDALAEAEPGTEFVGIDQHGEIVCRAGVSAGEVPCPF